ncbi:alpha/beta hydrolase family protein [Nocardia jejuensis]|uniref:alpha/beta hydrolase family protein n=1 Tax=Nocardia jejuensis TaxID=328049 RepID=UPI00082E741B|nr:alpha/beta fold hydrolase [Nocardia jejuensis]
MRTLRSLSLTLVVAGVLAASACSSSGSSSDSDKPTVSGDWHGNIEIPQHPIAVGVTFTDDGKATIDIPAQGLTDTPLTEVKTDPAAVSWKLPDIPGDPAFAGRYDKTLDTITGAFTQSGQSLTLNLTRGKVEGPPRPQEPKAPFPYKSEDINYRSGDITIAGTLTEPNTAGPHPAVLMISGSGAQDRNEELLGHKPFLLIADTLTRAGYAVLRTDDRGVGGTGGKLEESDYKTLADDVGAGMRYLRGRSDIDGARIGLMGHSEGGYLAPLYASRPDSGVAFAILMAGPAVTGADVLLEQNRLILAGQGSTPEQIATQIDYLNATIALYRAGDLDAVKKYAREYNAKQPEAERIPDAAIDQSVTPYMAALVDYDPAPALSALRIPVLAFYGSKDLQVPSAQSAGPAQTLLAQDPDATVHVFDGLNHLMQPADKGTPDEYTKIETTIDPQVLTYVTAWLTQRFPAGS